MMSRALQIFQASMQTYSHDHKETNTLLILNAFDAGKSNPFNEYIVYSSEIDVFLILIHYCSQFSNAMSFHTRRGEKLCDVNIDECFEVIEP